jgi:hypothetical protein
MRHRGLYKQSNTLDSDPASWVSQNRYVEGEEEVKEEVEDGKETHEDKDVDRSSFQFKENEERKLLRKFLITWECYFNKCRQEVPPSGKGKKIKIRK